jgi:hypothetical protein
MRLMTAVLIAEHVHEKVFNDRIAELLALFVIKESALYFEGLQNFNEWFIHVGILIRLC